MCTTKAFSANTIFMNGSTIALNSRTFNLFMKALQNILLSPKLRRETMRDFFSNTASSEEPVFYTYTDKTADLK